MMDDEWQEQMTFNCVVALPLPVIYATPFLFGNRVPLIDTGASWLPYGLLICSLAYLATCGFILACFVRQGASGTKQGLLLLCVAGSLCQIYFGLDLILGFPWSILQSLRVTGLTARDYMYALVRCRGIGF